MLDRSIGSSDGVQLVSSKCQGLGSVSVTATSPVTAAAMQPWRGVSHGVVVSHLKHFSAVHLYLELMQLLNEQSVSSTLVSLLFVHEAENFNWPWWIWQY